jgi:hypothetical protein
MLLKLGLIALAILLTTTIIPAVIITSGTFAVLALAIYAALWIFGHFVPGWILLVLCFVAWTCLRRSKG